MNYEAFHKLSYGLYIICSGNKDEKRGYVANTAFQVTAEPPQIAISCNKDNYTSGLIGETGYFSVSVLKQDASSDIIGKFGYETSKEVDKFKEDIDFTHGESGVPVVLSECVAWFECKLTMQFDAGSHIVFIGEVIGNELTEAEMDPLTYAYYRNVKHGLAPKNAPTYIDKAKLPDEDKQTEGSAKCLVCGYIYDPEKGDPDGGIEPGTPFEDIPDDWICPSCGATKDMFEVIS